MSASAPEDHPHALVRRPGRGRGPALRLHLRGRRRSAASAASPTARRSSWSSRWPASGSRRSTAGRSTRSPPRSRSSWTATTQEEVDHYWDLLGEGGDPEAQQCGWLKDRFGVSWQIVPTAARRVHERPGPGEGGAHDAGDAADEEAGHRGPQAGARRRGVRQRRLDAPPPGRHRLGRERLRTTARPATCPPATSAPGSAQMRAALRHEADADVPCGDCCACCSTSHFVHIGPGRDGGAGAQSRASCSSRRRACRPGHLVLPVRRSAAAARCWTTAAGAPSTTTGRSPAAPTTAASSRRPASTRTATRSRARARRWRFACPAPGDSAAAGRRPRRRALRARARGGVPRRRRCPTTRRSSPCSPSGWRTSSCPAARRRRRPAPPPWPQRSCARAATPARPEHWPSSAGRLPVALESAVELRLESLEASSGRLPEPASVMYRHAH